MSLLGCARRYVVGAVMLKDLANVAADRAVGAHVPRSLKHRLAWSARSLKRQRIEEASAMTMIASLLWEHVDGPRN